MTAGENDGYLVLPADDSSIPGIYVGLLQNYTVNVNYNKDRRFEKSHGSGTFIGQKVFLTCTHNFINNGELVVDQSEIYLKFKDDLKTNKNLIECDINNNTLKHRNIEGFNNSEGLSINDLTILITKTPYSIISGVDPCKISKFDINGKPPVRTFGYPGDASDNPIYEIIPKSRHLHYSPGKTTPEKSGLVSTDGEGVAGMSGGGVFTDDNLVVGVNIGGANTDTETISTIFVPITQDLYTWITNILKENKLNGWYTHNNNKYYFKDDVMYRNTTKVIGSKTYTFDENGVVTSEKLSNYYTQSGPGIMTVYDFNILNGTTKISIPTFEDPPDIQYFDFQIYPYGNKNKSIWKRVFLSKSKYIVKIDINEFNNLRSKYVVQAYATTKTKPRIDAGRLILDFRLESSGLVDIRTNDDKIFVDVNNISNKSVQEILATVWTDNYGQDDIKWYTLNKQDEIYRLILKTNEYSNGTKLNIHVHAKVNNIYLGLGNKYIIIGG